MPTKVQVEVLSRSSLSWALAHSLMCQQKIWRNHLLHHTWSWTEIVDFFWRQWEYRRSWLPSGSKIPCWTFEKNGTPQQDFRSFLDEMEEGVFDWLEGDAQSQSNTSGSEIAVWDIVPVNDPHPRTFWKLVRVMELNRSTDGQVRGACILIRSTGFTLQRPTQSLYPLLWRFMAHHQKRPNPKMKKIQRNIHTRPSLAAAHTAQ